MTELMPMEEILQGVNADTGAPWPAVPATEGKVYGFTCPSHGTEMVAMTKGTFEVYGTYMEAMRRANEQLDAKCKQLAAAEAAVADKFNDLASRHQNLRDKMRAERLAKVDQALITPSSETSVANAVRNIFKKR